MPEAERREVDAMLRGLGPKYQRQLSVSTSNALESFPILEAVVQYRKLVLLLDYDGTLTPIVKDPSKALLSERVRTVLTELPKHFITGVISGRSLGKIRAFVGVKGLFYAGSHGFDILSPSRSAYSVHSHMHRVASLGPASASCCGQAQPGAEAPPARTDTAVSCSNGEVAANGNTGDGEAGASGCQEAGSGGGEGDGDEEGAGGDCGALEEVRHQVAQEYLPVMETIRDQLVAELKGIDKAEVEDNRFSVSIHYRNCARVDVPRVKEVVERVQARHERIRMGSGKEVFELQPDIAWDKGKAVLWLLDKLVMPMAQAPEEPAPPPPPPGEGGGAVTPPPPPVGTAAAAAASSSNGGSGGAGATKEEEEGDYDDEYSGRVFTIFIGDDKTDENAFRVLNGDMGEDRARHDGVGILVSEESRETNAAYTLRNPDEVASFLEKIAMLGIERCGSLSSR